MTLAFWRRQREWVWTGATRLHWEQGGTVTLDAEQRDALSGKTRWRRARHLTVSEYRQHLCEHMDRRA